MVVQEMTLRKAIRLALDDIKGSTGQYYGEPRRMGFNVKGKRRPSCEWCGSRRVKLRTYRTRWPEIICLGCKEIIGYIQPEAVPHGLEEEH